MVRARNRKRVDTAGVRSAVWQGLVGAGRSSAGVFGFLLVVGLAAVGGKYAKAWALAHPYFGLEGVEYQGLQRATEDELTRLGGLAAGDNLLALDLDEAERAMAQHPWIRTLDIERDLPRKLRVKVTEHTAVALADLGGFYYVNEDGKPFKKLAPGEGADLPLLRGFGREEYAATPADVERGYQEALVAIGAFAQSGLEEAFPISEVHYDRVEGVTLVCGADAFEVRLGRGDYEEKYRKLGQLLTELARRGAKPGVIRLDNRTRPGWVAVQLAQGGGR